MLWTSIVWVAFLVLAPLWTILWFQRHPVLGIMQGAFIVTFLLHHALTELRRDRRHDPTRDTRDTPRTS